MVQRPLGYWRLSDGRTAFVSERVINRGVIGGEILGMCTSHPQHSTAPRPVAYIGDRAATDMPANGGSEARRP